MVNQGSGTVDGTVLASLSLRGWGTLVAEAIGTFGGGKVRLERRFPAQATSGGFEEWQALAEADSPGHADYAWSGPQEVRLRIKGATGQVTGRLEAAQNSATGFASPTFTDYLTP